MESDKGKEERTEENNTLLELIGFLNSPKPEIRRLAAKHLASTTAEKEGIEKLFSVKQDLVEALMKRLSDEFVPFFLQNSFLSLTPFYLNWK